MANEALGAAAVVSAAMGMGLLTCPAGPNVVRFTPPLTISEEEIDEGVQIIRRVLRNLNSGSVG